MEGGVSRRTEERGLILGTATVLWQESYLVLGRDRVLRVYKHRADLLLDKHEVCVPTMALPTVGRLYSTHHASTYSEPTYQVVGLEQLPESVLLHGARAELTDSYPEAEGRPHSVRLSSAGKQRQL
jgi:hypothetical protein